MEELTADGVVYHKSCFRCNHCKGTLKLSNYSSLEGVLYCKPHLKQLVKETGSFNKILQPSEKSRQVLTRSSGTVENTTFELKRSASKVEKLTPQLTRVPSKAAMMFSGTQEKCITCGKTAYPLEKVTVEGQSYHKSCFKCFHGGCSISPSNYAALQGILYCKHHFSQLFREKGSYNHLIKCASVKRAAAPLPDL